MKAICVFCGSASGLRPEYADAARRVGHEVARRGLDLVYGAGDVGLMGIVADAALEAGGRVIGVIPHSLVEREVAHQRLTELHVVQTMHQRKALMADKSDAFLALPGGFGTAEELFEILTWGQLGIHSKPVGLLDVAGYFAPMLAWLDLAVREGFLKAKHRDLLYVGQVVEEMLERLLSAKPGPTVEKWVRPDER